jgi:mevalonate kinase
MHIIENYVKDHHGVMKFSGAGGGDCVLAFFPTENDYDQAYQTIKRHFPILNSFFKGV